MLLTMALVTFDTLPTASVPLAYTVSLSGQQRDPYKLSRAAFAHFVLLHRSISRIGDRYGDTLIGRSCGIYCQGRVSRCDTVDVATAYG